MINNYTRAFVPAWLSSPDQIAPCFCGKPPDVNNPALIMTHESGLRRWFHATCFNQMMNSPDHEDET